MIRNYFKIAFRNLTSNFSYTLTNIIGLAIGMACCFLIGLYVRFELSYESFHAHKQALYRYIPRSTNQGELAMQTYTPAGMAPFFKAHFHEIAAFTRFSGFDDRPLFEYHDQALSPEPFAMADSAFFHMFSFKLTRGEPATALNRPFTIVISESVAERFFSNEDPIGYTIEYDNKISFEITGVFEDVPVNSHLRFSYVASFVSMPGIIEKIYGWKNPDLLNDFGAWNYAAYFLIPDADITALQDRLTVKLYEHQAKGEQMPQEYATDWLQPLTQIHFTKGIKGDPGGTGSISHLYLFTSVAVFVLLIACFNFMNLSTALALRRAKEVGLRKVMGAMRMQLVTQFLGETFLLVLVAFIIAFQLVELTLPLFNSLMGTELTFSIWQDAWFFGAVLLAGLVTALLAGSYPAFYLSSFMPSRVLKGDKLRGGNAGLRKILTVAQFGIATFMIIGTITVFQQMQYMKNSNLGFDKEHVITFNTTVALHDKFDEFKNIVMQNSGVKGVSLCGGVPGQTLSHWSYRFPDGEHRDVSINTVAMDYDYLDVIGLQLVDGRKLSPEFSTDDSLAYLINETAAKSFLLEKPVGTRFQVLDGEHPPGRIVGVVKDYHFRSLQHHIDPLVLRIERGNAWRVAIKLTPGDLQEKISLIKDAWHRISPGYPFDYTFLDESYEKLYQAEAKTTALMTAFSVLAILVACLGLLGLTSFLTQQRRQEISIRKVHGAGIRDIVQLLSWDFVKLVLAGFVVTAPIAWFAADKWLMNFAFRIDVSVWTFLLAGVLITLFAIITVSYQSYKASLSNPAEVLKEK